MRAIPNLIDEVEVLNPASLPWSQVWGAEVLGRAIGHEVRYLRMNDKPGSDIGFAPIVRATRLPAMLVVHHVADVLA